MRKLFRSRDSSDPAHPRLKFIVTFREFGKRKRRFFATRREAETFTQHRNIEFQNQGWEHGEFPSALRIIAAECADMPASLHAGRWNPNPLPFASELIKMSLLQRKSDSQTAPRNTPEARCFTLHSEKQKARGLSTARLQCYG